MIVQQLQRYGNPTTTRFVSTEDHHESDFSRFAESSKQAIDKLPLHLTSKENHMEGSEAKTQGPTGSILCQSPSKRNSITIDQRNPAQVDSSLASKIVSVVSEEEPALLACSTSDTADSLWDSDMLALYVTMEATKPQHDQILRQERLRLQASNPIARTLESKSFDDIDNVLDGARPRTLSM